MTQGDGSVGYGLVSTVGDVVVSLADSAVTLNSNVSAAASITLLAENGTVAQGRNATADAAGGSFSITAQDGVDVATVIAQGEITLVLTKEVGPNEDPPMFRRVNDAVAFEDSGDFKQGKLADTTSETGTIVLLAPSASVGSVDSGQSFVQSADQGIYYGLNSGRFFSDDIGPTPLLQTIPTDTLANFEVELADLGSSFTTASEVAVLLNGLTDSLLATASAGNTPPRPVRVLRLHRSAERKRKWPKSTNRPL